MIGTKAPAMSGKIGCVTRGTERGRVKSAMTNLERLAGVVTVSTTSLSVLKG